MIRVVYYFTIGIIKYRFCLLERDLVFSDIFLVLIFVPDNFHTYEPVPKPQANFRTTAFTANLQDNLTAKAPNAAPETGTTVAHGATWFVLGALARLCSMARRQ
jgi:hypothetical protein